MTAETIIGGLILWLALALLGLTLFCFAPHGDEREDEK